VAGHQRQRARARIGIAGRQLAGIHRAFVEFYAVEAAALLRPHEHIMRAFTKEVLRRRTMTDADNDEVIAASVAAKSIEDEQMKISAGPTGNASSNRPRLSLIYCRSVHNIRIGIGGPVCAVASGIGRKRTWPIWAGMSVSTLTVRPTLLARAPHHITGHAVRRNRFRSANASRCGHDAAQA
jgi:hypothetical protein